jgi:hypothetical protein
MQANNYLKSRKPRPVTAARRTSSFTSETFRGKRKILKFINKIVPFIITIIQLYDI